ncbi:hypothetical protein BJX63DRAFT_388965 [Aspergillus granulosus]|uniref:Uncharacterized protein n=1 Tax=Aspergillus granulosus TaxID=176169 RepID=A0ABR4HML1_9EURO
MPKDPYKTYETGAGIAEIGAAAAGAATGFANPTGPFLNAFSAYHDHKFRKIRFEGDRQALANAPAGEERRRQWSSAQMRSSEPLPENGIMLPMDERGRLIVDDKTRKSQNKSVGGLFGGPQKQESGLDRASQPFPENGFTDEFQNKYGRLIDKSETKKDGKRLG